MKLLIESVSKSFGIVTTRLNTITKEIEISSYEDAIWDEHVYPIFYIDSHITCDFFSASFTSNHPYYETLLQYQKDTNLSYENSALRKYYDDFQPSSVDDIFHDGIYHRSTTSSSGLYEYVLPWDNKVKRNKFDVPLPYSGPFGSKQGEKELLHLISVYNSIKKKGYVPDKWTNVFQPSHIQGYFLRRNHNYRFIVLHGKHRMASLAALGNQRIPVTFEIGRHRVIDIEELNDWPQVRKGKYTKEQAQEIFNSFWDHSSGEKKV